MKKIRLNKKELIILSILSFLSVTIIDFFHFGGDDIRFHLDNITNIVNNFKEVVSEKYFIMPNIGNNLGYGLYIFYPVLPHLFYGVIAKILGYIGISVSSSIILVNGIVSIISTICFYHLSNKLFKDKQVAFYASLFFIFFPYRISNYLFRAAINESFCLIFIPLILTSFIYLEEKNRKLFYTFFCIGYIGLLLSHLVISMYFTIILIIYLLLNYKKYLKKNMILDYMLATITVIIMVLPNIIMMLEHYKLGYLIFLEGYMSNLKNLTVHGLHLKDFFSFSNHGILTYIPLIYIFSFLMVFYYDLKYKKIKNNLCYIIIVIILIFFSTYIPWKYIPKIFWMIQFPWRLEIILCIFFGLYAPRCIVYKNIKYYKYAFGIMIGLSMICNYYYFIKDDSYFADYKVEYKWGDGELHEYYPTEFALYSGYYEQKKNIDVMTGKADIKIKSKYPDLVFKVSNIEGETIIELPRLYYKGYDFEFDGNKVTFGRGETGLIKAYIYKNGTYTLTYNGTPAYQILRLIRFLLILVFIYFLVLKKLGIWKGTKNEKAKRNKSISTL